jgi:hypothetical protein
MVEFTKKNIKDLGRQVEVEESLPYANVGGAWEGSFQGPATLFTALNHIVPAGQQLKLLFLRIWTQEAGGARFSIVQTNPTQTGQTGAVEAYPVVGSVPQGVRDYPMLEAAGAEVLRGGLVDPVHVFEGSINFNILATPTPATGAHYGIVWWGVEKNMPPSR